jgi:hypothetical protein
VPLKTHYKVDQKIASKDSKLYAGTLRQMNTDVVMHTLNHTNDTNTWDEVFNRTRNQHRSSVSNLSRSVVVDKAPGSNKKSPFPSIGQSTYDVAVNDIGNHLVNFKHPVGRLN